MLQVDTFFILFSSGEKIFPAAWEVIEVLELFEIPVVSLVSDGAKPNRDFTTLHYHFIVLFNTEMW